MTITGASGSGKTLLLRAIADLDPNDGDVLLNGRSRRTFRPAQWRSRVRLLPAESQWWADRIGEHFQGTPEGLAELGFPPSVLEWEVARCSTGERQRLALLRLLQGSPKVLLLDEPTASLDPASTERVEGLLARYRREQGAGILWISHDPAQVARVADRHLQIREGRLEEEERPWR